MPSNCDIEMGEPSTPTTDLFRTEPPELAQWDLARQTPISQEVLDKIPIEIWAMILTRVPPTRLARFLAVSKRWNALIPELPLWREIITNCSLDTITIHSMTEAATAADPVTHVEEKPISNQMKHVLDHMVVICDCCHQRSYNYGDNLPLPVRRPDLLGLVWMCKPCRDVYGTMHPEVMSDPTRAFKDSDVYAQGACVKIPRKRRAHRCESRFDRSCCRGTWHEGYDGYDMDDEELDTDEEEYYEEECGHAKERPAWKSTTADPNSWLNRTLRQGRTRLLRAMLGMYGLQLRGDSRLCTDFIDGTHYDPRKIVATMREMNWFFKRTEYPQYNYSRGPERSKAMALSVWVRGLEHEHPGTSMKMLKVVQDAPPESLWTKVQFVLDQLCAHESQKRQEKEQRDLRRQQRELQRHEREARQAEEQEEDEMMEEDDSSEDEMLSDADSDKFMESVAVALLNKFTLKVDCTSTPQV
ncbi:hypothetical protein B0O80DRAFT_504084 [Mortierella sp. GBAus27b]|nr:hypothetical protein BGX31_001268 [Mortierella sp. GBA43]KAI8345735.1 hypothetical protein B0O80DRAFT_504084 [Mortierella sp. GBAus27b]